MAQGSIALACHNSTSATRWKCWKYIDPRKQTCEYKKKDNEWNTGRFLTEIAAPISAFCSTSIIAFIPCKSFTENSLSLSALVSFFPTVFFGAQKTSTLRSILKGFLKDSLQVTPISTCSKFLELSECYFSFVPIDVLGRVTLRKTENSPL